MSRLYLIIPCALVLLFGGLYFQHAQTAAADAKSATTADALARQKAADAQQELERKAQADAAQRLAAQRADEKKKEEAQRAKWDADTARLVADTAAAESRVITLAAEVAQLETQLTALRATKDHLSRETFDLEKSVALAQITKRTTELEVQRLTAMLARQAAGLTPPPLPPAAR